MLTKYSLTLESCIKISYSKEMYFSCVILNKKKIKGKNKEYMTVEYNLEYYKHVIECKL